MKLALALPVGILPETTSCPALPWPLLWRSPWVGSPAGWASRSRATPVLVAVLFGLLIGNSLGYPDGLRPGSISPNVICSAWRVVLVGFRITVRLVPGRERDAE